MYKLILQRTPSALVPFLLLTGVCIAQSTERVSVDSLGIEGDLDSCKSSISADGRYVAFQSRASNLVPGDTNGTDDIFVHDCQIGGTQRVSVNSVGVEANRASSRPAISADGRFVAFESLADNLVPGDTNLIYDIFVHDRQSGITERASISSLGTEGNAGSWGPSLSRDGRYVAFVSWAEDLVPGDTNGKGDVFVRDRRTGVTNRVSVNSSGTAGNEWSESASISADGRWVAFHSYADNLVPGDSNGKPDVFVYDRITGTPERVSLDSTGAEGNDGSFDPSISADGRHIAFSSDAWNLVSDDTNSFRDIFVHDRQMCATDRVSVNALGVEGNSWSDGASISANGRHVAFESYSDNLVPGDHRNRNDAFVHDRETGMTERVSVDSFGAEADRASANLAISRDGRHVTLGSFATNLVTGDLNQRSDIFVHDRWSGLGQNSIYLTGPTTAPVGAPIEFAWQSARGNSNYWLLFSQNIDGAWADGHQFDLGYPVTILVRGVNTTHGTGSHTSNPVPPRAAGYTIYFEVAARDENGVAYDSNVVGVTFQ